MRVNIRQQPRPAGLRRLKAGAVRPTLDRVKEAAFNIIQFHVPGCRFLDMFAGSGQIGIEALSRGAASASFFEPDPAAYRLGARERRPASGRAGCAPVPGAVYALAQLSAQAGV